MSNLLRNSCGVFSLLAMTILAACSDDDCGDNCAAEGSTGGTQTADSMTQTLTTAGESSSFGTTNEVPDSVDSSSSTTSAANTNENSGNSGNSSGAVSETQSASEGTTGSTDEGETNLDAAEVESVDTATQDGDESDSMDTDESDSGSSDADSEDELIWVESLVSAICEWSTRCCDDGELDYILGPYVNNETECVDRFMQLLATNDQSVGPDEQKLNKLGNTFRSLPYSLAYRIRLDRSRPIKAGILACRDAWQIDSCRAPNPVHAPACDEDPIDRSCQLDRLFEGRADKDDFCNFELSGPHTDIECRPGTTCEAADDLDPDNPQNFRCVYKGRSGDHCTPQNLEKNGSCEYGLYCEKNTATCKPRPDVGETCAYADPDFPQADQLTIPCDHDLYCDPVTDLCVAECTEGYACGPRLEINRPGPGRPGLDDDLALQYPTPDFKSPSASEDRCGAGLSCRPHRNDPRGIADPERPGDPGYYFGKGTDRYGTTFECRLPGDTGAECDTSDDCLPGRFCQMTPGHPLVDDRRDGVEHLPHHHDGSGDGSYAETGRCALALDAGMACLFHQDGSDFHSYDPGSAQWPNLMRIADARCPEGYFCNHAALPNSSSPNGRFVEGACEPLRRTNDACERHEDCDPDETAGLCLATDEGSLPGEPNNPRKRCAAGAISKSHLCVPMAGLGTEQPSEFDLQKVNDPARRIVSNAAAIPWGWSLGPMQVGVAPDYGAPFPFWNGAHYPTVFAAVAVDPYPFWHDVLEFQTPKETIDELESAHLFAADGYYTRNHVYLHQGRARAARGPGDFDSMFWGWPSEGSLAEEDASGGMWPAFAWMQALALNLRRDTQDGVAGGGYPLDRLRRSDYRHLAHHCDNTDGLTLCDRDPADGMYRCRIGALEGESCDNDLNSCVNCDRLNGPGLVDGLPTCAPGLECFQGRCRAHLQTGDTCELSDTGHNNMHRTVRCDWRHREPVYRDVPCPSTISVYSTDVSNPGVGPEPLDFELDYSHLCDDEGFLLDRRTGARKQYIYEYDSGCEKVHGKQMCRLYNEQATDLTYCDGR